MKKMRRSTLVAALGVSSVVLILTLWASTADESLYRSVVGGAGGDSRGASSEAGGGDSSASIACYEADDAENALPDVEDEPAEARGAAIFFHETSCLSSRVGAVTLTPRQACAVESAARANPNVPVFLLMAAPVPPAPADANSTVRWSAAARQLSHYPNVKVRHLRLDDYVRETPLEQWYRGGALRASRWPRSHASDVLRFLTLWKFGGTYLDLDVVVTKSLEGLKNFAGAESSSDVAAGVLNFAPTGRGHALATACLGDLRAQFRGDDWGHNGPGVITRVLKRACAVRQVRDMTPEACRGFTVHPPPAFYPIPWRQWKLYFDEQQSNKTMSRLRGSLAIHVWNKFSYSENVTVGSRQPYGLIASEFCPRVYHSSGKVF